MYTHTHTQLHVCVMQKLSGAWNKISEGRVKETVVNVSCYFLIKYLQLPPEIVNVALELPAFQSQLSTVHK